MIALSPASQKEKSGQSRPLTIALGVAARGAEGVAGRAVAAVVARAVGPLEQVLRRAQVRAGGQQGAGVVQAGVKVLLTVSTCPRSSLVQWSGLEVSCVQSNPVQSTTVQFSSVQFSSVQHSTVQFKMVSMRSGRPIYAPPRLSGVSPMLPLKEFQCWSD